MFAGRDRKSQAMVARASAEALSSKLHRIDQSSVTNEYIGETEKNLRQLFDAVEDGGAILSFDEVDALFGKRSEVNDRHDRYVHADTDYLLQQIDGYLGIVILVSNDRRDLGNTFLRRVRFEVK